MNATTRITVAVSIALGATLAFAGSAPRPAINPQPLPPRHDPTGMHPAINPQPLPPRDPTPTIGRPAPARPAYIGETEKNGR